MSRIASRRRAGIAVDVLCALLVIPIWTYYGAIVALVCALVLGLLLRFVVHTGTPKQRKRI